MVQFARLLIKSNFMGSEHNPWNCCCVPKMLLWQECLFSSKHTINSLSVIITACFIKAEKFSSKNAKMLQISTTSIGTDYIWGTVLNTTKLEINFFEITRAVYLKKWEDYVFFIFHLFISFFFSDCLFSGFFHIWLWVLQV